MRTEAESNGYEQGLDTPKAVFSAQLNEFNRRILESETVQQAVNLTAYYTREATRAHAVAVFLFDDKGEINLRHIHDSREQRLRDDLVSVELRLIQQVRISGEPIWIQGNRPEDSELFHPVLMERGIQSLAGIPLKVGSALSIGVLIICYATVHDFQPSELERLSQCAAQASGVIQYLRLLSESRKRETALAMMVDTAHLLISTLEVEDLLQQIAIRLAWVTGMDSCAISSYSRNPDRVQLMAQYTSLGERREEHADEVFFLDDYPATRRVIEKNEPLYIRVDDPLADTAEVALLRKEKMQALLMLPLWAEGQPLGLVEIYGSRAGQVFTEADFKRLRALSEQVALALVKANHYAEEQRARLTAETLRNAVSALNSTLELNQVLNLILEQLQKVVHYNSASLMLVDGEYVHIVAVRGHPYPDEALRVRFLLREDSLASEIFSNQKSIILGDAQNDPRFRSLAHTENVHGWMGIPLITREQVIGMLTVDNYLPGAYTEADASVARTFASQAALAVTNARLYQSERKNRTLSEALSEVSLALASSLKLGELLDLIMEQIGRVVPYDSSSVILVEDGVGRVVRHRGFERFGTVELVTNYCFDIQNTASLKQMVDTLQPYLASDVSTAPGWLITPVSKHIQSCLGAPLVVRDRLLGFITLDNMEKGFYTVEHAQNLDIFARHAALAVLNALTYGEVEQASIIDFLTGAYNHRYFYQQLQVELERASRSSHPLSLLMIDLDEFKNVNDQHGHLCGDQVLRAIAARFKAVLRTTDLLARYGGEEFTVILPGTPLSGAIQVAERVRTAIAEQPVVVGNLAIPITVSVGVAVFPDHAQVGNELVSQADKAMYLAKSEGRNRVCPVQSGT